jgi:hypothetical protein
MMNAQELATAYVDTVMGQPNAWGQFVHPRLGASHHVMRALYELVGPAEGSRLIAQAFDDNREAQRIVAAVEQHLSPTGRNPKGWDEVDGVPLPPINWAADYGPTEQRIMAHMAAEMQRQSAWDRFCDHVHYRAANRQYAKALFNAARNEACDRYRLDEIRHRYHTQFTL